MSPSSYGSRVRWSHRDSRRSSRPSARSTTIAALTDTPVQYRHTVAHDSSHASSQATSRRNSERSESVATTRAPTRSSVEDDPSIDDPLHDDSLNEVVMAVDVRSRGTVGCAYYVAREERLHFMEDVKLGGADIVEACPAFSLPFYIPC